jgi:hypothetical protein
MSVLFASALDPRQATKVIRKEEFNEAVSLFGSALSDIGWTIVQAGMEESFSLCRPRIGPSMTKFPFDVTGRWYFQYRARDIAQAQGHAKDNHDDQADIIQHVEFFVYS